MEVVGKPEKNKNDEVVVRLASPGYLATVGTRLREGRYFSEEDEQTKQPVAVINQALAQKYFAGEEAVGQQIKFWDKPAIRIIGVIDDLHEGPLEMKVRPAFYVPFSVSPGYGLWDGGAGGAGAWPVASAECGDP